MGAWSAEIFDDDDAADIIDEYKILLGYGMSPREAYQKISGYFYPDYEDAVEGKDVYWLSIALFQWKNGILMDEVKERALECIADESYLERWKDSGEEIYQERKQVLEKLRYNLMNVVNEEKKKFPKCPADFRRKTKWKAGDLLAYKMTAPIKPWGDCFSSDEKKRLRNTQERIKNGYLLLRVVKNDKTPVSGICPDLDYASSAVVMLYDWMGETLPEGGKVERIPFKPIVNNYFTDKKEIVSAVCLEPDSPKEEKKWAEITLVKREENFQVPEMYLQHPGTPLDDISQFSLSLIHTFALREDEQTEWVQERTGLSG